MAKQAEFDEIEARYIANWIRRCNAMDVGERGGSCRHCPEVNGNCTGGLMERAAVQLELAAKMNRETTGRTRRY